MKVCSPSANGTSTDQIAEPATIFIGVAPLIHPLKEPTRKTCFAPDASTVNRTVPATDFGIPDFNTGELAQAHKPIVNRIAMEAVQLRRLSAFSLISMRERVLEHQACCKEIYVHTKSPHRAPHSARRTRRWPRPRPADPQSTASRRSRTCIHIGQA